MNCPICDGVKLREVEKEGILIDVCPSCKGVWLDRGELDKLMQGVREVRDDFNTWYDERQQPSPQQPTYNQQQQHTYNQHQPYNQQQPYNQPYGNKHNDKHSHYPYGKHKKKKSVMDLFGDLFD